MNDYFKIIGPEWPEISNVNAFTILSNSKLGEPVFFNGESEIANENRNKLEMYIKPKIPIHWIKQIHSNKIIELPASNDIEADGSFTNVPGIVCAVKTADCLPIVFTNSKCTKVGIVHAGWRGLYNEIIGNMIAKLNEPIKDLLVWIGPGISSESYEVGSEIYDKFTNLDINFGSAFTKKINGKYQADLYMIAKIQLINLGVKTSQISGAKWDTFSNLDLHSSRRDGERSGRMATVVWINE